MFERFYSKNRIIRSIAISIIISGVLFLFTMVDGIRRQHRIEAPIIFSMQDIGYTNSEVINSKLNKSWIKETGNSVLSYNLYLQSLDDLNDPVMLEFTIFLCSDEDAMEVIKSSIIAIKEGERPHCTTKCYYPPIIYEDAIDEMFQLNAHIWGIDMGYSQINYTEATAWEKHMYEMVLLKGSKVLSIKLDKDIYMSSEVIKTIVSIFEKAEKLKGELE